MQALFMLFALVMHTAVVSDSFCILKTSTKLEKLRKDKMSEYGFSDLFLRVLAIFMLALVATCCRGNTLIDDVRKIFCQPRTNCHIKLLHSSLKNKNVL